MWVLDDAGMGWSGGDMSKLVDGVGSGTLAGSTCIGDGGHILYIWLWWSYWLNWNWLYGWWWCWCMCCRRCGHRGDGNG